MCHKIEIPTFKETIVFLFFYFAPKGTSAVASKSPGGNILKEGLSASDFPSLGNKVKQLHVLGLVAMRETLHI